jgi:hypothetical protein
MVIIKIFFTVVILAFNLTLVASDNSKPQASKVKCCQQDICFDEDNELTCTARGGFVNSVDRPALDIE